MGVGDGDPVDVVVVVAAGGCEGPSGPGPGLLPERDEEPRRRALLSMFSMSVLVVWGGEVRAHIPENRFDIVYSLSSLNEQ